MTEVTLDAPSVPQLLVAVSLLRPKVSTSQQLFEFSLLFSEQLPSVLALDHGLSWEC